MHFQPIASLLLVFSASSALSGEGPARRLDAPPRGTFVIYNEAGCDETSSPNDDGNFEAAVTWAGAGVISPLGGAFAQRFMFADTVRICAVGMFLTQSSERLLPKCDLYIWDGSLGEPTTVVAMRSVTAGPSASWPWISEHVFQLDACVVGETWIGYWGNWPGEDEGWYVAANVGEDSGLARTYVAPGVTERAGWQPPSQVWDRIANVGINVSYDVEPCAITPIDEGSWGRIKALYSYR